jgi:putative ABC transport system substrate-binding protein
LRELGYVEGTNLVIEWRFADGEAERLPDLAAELVRLKVDVIVSGSSAAIGALQRATTTIPIVMATSADPIGSGFVKSLARPGGNITGLSNLTSDIGTKQLTVLALPCSRGGPGQSNQQSLGVSENFSPQRKGAT